MANSRHALIVKLSTLAACAFLVAQGTTDLIVNRYFALDRSVSVEAIAASVPTETKDDWAILSRNIFDGTPLVGEGSDGTDRRRVHTRADGALPACDGALRLVATVAHTANGDLSIAAIVDATGSADVYRQGQSVDARRLKQVGLHHVVMHQSGEDCQLTMFGTVEARALGSAAVIVTASGYGYVRGRRGEGGVDRDILVAGVTRSDGATFNDGLVASTRAHRESVFQSVHVLPHEENGRVVGIKVYGIRRDQLLGRLGIQNGDLVRTINGYDLSSPDAALEAYATLRGADHLALNLLRRGEPMTLDYHIQ
ncbi:MAG: type II secretion system protein GspC [Myxococcota bacterium]